MQLKLENVVAQVVQIPGYSLQLGYLGRPKLRKVLFEYDGAGNNSLDEAAVVLTITALMAADDKRKSHYFSHAQASFWLATEPCSNRRQNSARHQTKAAITTATRLRFDYDEK